MRQQGLRPLKTHKISRIPNVPERYGCFLCCEGQPLRGRSRLAPVDRPTRPPALTRPRTPSLNGDTLVRCVHGARAWCGRYLYVVGVPVRTPRDPQALELLLQVPTLPILQGRAERVLSIAQTACLILQGIP